MGEEFPRFSPRPEPEPEPEPEPGFEPLPEPDFFLIMSSVMTVKVERKEPKSEAVTFLPMVASSSLVK